MSVEEYFRDKVCVVTGAASGIGFVLSEALLQAGAVVLMADLDTERFTAAVDQLSPHAGRVHAMPVDVTKQEQVQKMVEGTAARHGRLDVLFNNAGIGGTAPIKLITLEHWRRSIDINLWGVIYGIHAVLPIKRRQGGGHIVNTASNAGLIPCAYEVLYCATKYAVVGLSESLRFELGDQGIHVSVVCFGPVVTPIFGNTKPPDIAISARRPHGLPLKASPTYRGSSSYQKKPAVVAKLLEFP
jgi:NAD(P)-dependent dehydrogenase (short-subunit alcohol dehydrogenase family)